MFRKVKMDMQNILIVNLSDTGNEAEALRQTLERMNFFFGVKNIGRPKDFINVLSGETPFNPDCIIISCHGDNGKIIMPMLGESVYFKDEPRGDFSSEEITQFLKISKKTIVNLGCTTGSNDIATAFSANNTYIAPWDYVDSNAALFFTIKLFYELTSKQCAIKDAYLSARETDNETQLFCLYQNGVKQ